MRSRCEAMAESALPLLMGTLSDDAAEMPDCFPRYLDVRLFENDDGIYCEQLVVGNIYHGIAPAIAKFLAFWGGRIVSAKSFRNLGSEADWRGYWPLNRQYRCERLEAPNRFRRAMLWGR